MATSVSAEPLYSHLRIIAPAAPGGGWDQTARAMQPVLQTAGLATTTSVENIPGAGGTIGLAQLIDAERGNGSVVMVSGLIMLAAIESHHSPVTLRDVTPIARLTGEYEVLVVPARSPYATLSDLLNAFRVRPESIAWAGGSAGGGDQILAGLIAEAVGVSPRRVNYVPFAGGGESMAAILGGQVAVGISGFGEYAAQIAAGTVRILAISSAERLPALDAPTLREQGVDVVFEIWRSLVGPPAMSSDDRARMERAIATMVQSPAWHETLRRFQWNDRYLAGDAFAQFAISEGARVRSILAKLGTAATSTSTSLGGYPLFVLAALVLTIAISSRPFMRRPPVDDQRQPLSSHEGQALRPADYRQVYRHPITLIALAIVIDVLLIERAGFIIAAIPLFWLTARAFDPRHPVRDAIVAVALSTGTYFMFARLLQISLPAGVLAPWV